MKPYIYICHQVCSSGVFSTGLSAENMAVFTLR